MECWHAYLSMLVWVCASQSLRIGKRSGSWHACAERTFVCPEQLSASSYAAAQWLVLAQGAYAILMNYMIGPSDVRRHGECDGCSWTMEVLPVAALLLSDNASYLLVHAAIRICSRYVFSGGAVEAREARS